MWKETFLILAPKCRNLRLFWRCIWKIPPFLYYCWSVVMHYFGYTFVTSNISMHHHYELILALCKANSLQKDWCSHILKRPDHQWYYFARWKCCHSGVSSSTTAGPKRGFYIAIQSYKLICSTSSHCQPVTILCIYIHLLNIFVQANEQHKMHWPCL